MPELIESWERTRTFAELHIAVDDDDETRHEYRKILKDAPRWVHWTLVASTGMVNAMNYLAQIDARLPHDIIGFMGDDHRPRSIAWDAQIQVAWERGGRVIYANDLLQGKNLPTQVALDARIVQRLGYMAPAVLTHLYVDNYWKSLGESLGALQYLPHVIIEHMHPVAQKAEWDDGYRRVNDGSMYERDHKAFLKYVDDERLLRDIETIGDLSGS
jgi:hypothetical protein